MFTQQRLLHKLLSHAYALYCFQACFRECSHHACRHLCCMHASKWPSVIQLKQPQRSLQTDNAATMHAIPSAGCTPTNGLATRLCTKLLLLLTYCMSSRNVGLPVSEMKDEYTKESSCMHTADPASWPFAEAHVAACTFACGSAVPDVGVPVYEMKDDTPNSQHALKSSALLLGFAQSTCCLLSRTDIISLTLRLCAKHLLPLSCVPMLLQCQMLVCPYLR